MPNDGIIVIESTAEGRDGEFYKMCGRALKMQEANADLTERDYRMHFVPWWDAPEYVLPNATFALTDKDKKYFDELEAKIGRAIDMAHKRWYVQTRDADFSGDDEKMWQEYPGTPDEAFQVSTEGTYYAQQLALARKQGHICVVPHASGIPVNTFWDIGSSDGTAIWLHQKVGLTHRFIGFIEGWGEPYDYFAKEMQKTQYLWGTHYVPHDVMHKRQQGKVVKAPITDLKALAIGGEWHVVPVIDDLQTGIQLVRSVFSQCWFDAVACDAGIKHLEGYRKQWNERLACWSDKPVKNVHTEAADALRQFAQSHELVGAQVKQQPKVETVTPSHYWNRRSA